MASSHPLLDIWESFLPRFQSIIAPMHKDPNRICQIDDDFVFLNDKTYRELEISYNILRPHVLTYTILLSMPLNQHPITFLKNALTSSTILLREAEQNINILQNGPQGQRWRSVYSHTAIFVSIAILALLIHDECTQGPGTRNNGILDQKIVDGWNWQDAIYHLDFALIKSSGWPVTAFIHDFLSLIDKKLLPMVDKGHKVPIDWRCKDEKWCSWIVPSEPVIKFPGKKIHAPNITQWREIYSQQKPVKLTGIMDHWPVFDMPSNDGEHKSKWSCFQYLLSKTINGRRIIPVEIGKTYADPDLQQKIVTFRSYFSSYFLKGHEQDSSGTEEGAFGYLAQHDLLTQIPSLRDDICIPDYINYTEASSIDDGGESTDEHVLTTINAWLGPANTITPLHTDNYHNIFCQVVGRKYIRLYPPEAKEAIFPMGENERGIDMHNTSSLPIDWVENESKGSAEEEEGEKWEKFKNEEYVEFLVEPGEAVFFPKGWWHYVRSVEASFSVNFWWGGDK